MTTFLATWRQPGIVALEHAWAARDGGADLKTCLEQGLAACELDPNLVAIGLGSLPNSDGELELDASIMDGSDLSAGAVCGLRGIVPAISVARRVMEDTPHIMLCGEQARRFALSKGFTPRNLMTEANIKRYEDWRKKPVRSEESYVHAVEETHGDTVTMLAWESPGRLVAASSTSGLAWKMPGRVGDSPIIGAGIYADDEVGAAGATGFGEELWKGVASFKAVEAMRNGLNPQQACDITIAQLLRRQPKSVEIPCVVFAMDRLGNYGAATTIDNFPLWVCEDGKHELKVFSAMVR